MMEKSIHSPENAAFLAALKRTRKRAGLSQADLAERLQETQSWVSKCERGERRLDLLEVRALCRAIGVSFLQFAAEVDAELQRLEQKATT